MDEPTVDIVIVNWNSGAYLADCVRSIQTSEQRGYRISSVTVVDNASHDGSADVSATRLPLCVVQNEMNVGFAAACNQGARLGQADLILFLNPDTQLRSNSLALSVPHFDDDPAIWVVGIRLVNDEGSTQRTCRRLPTPTRLIARALGIDRLWPQCGYVMTTAQHAATRNVDQVIGAFYMTRRSAFERLGGFDERFFVYFEDLDLSLRAKAAGGKSLYVWEATAYHAGGGTTRSIRATRHFYSVRSRLQFTRKHFGSLAAIAVSIVALTVEPLVRTLVALWHRSGTEVAEVWRAYALLVRWTLR